MKKFLVIFCVCISTLMANGLISGQLDNGFKYHIMNNDKPKDYVSVRMRVDVGSLAEEDGEEGLAHFLEHMAFNGTEKYEGNSLIRVLEERGIGFAHGLNAHTNFNETLYKLQGQVEDLDVFLDIMSQWAYAMTFDELEVEKEKGVVIEEWRQSTGLNQELFRFYLDNLYKGSRYLDRLAIGKLDTIKTFTPQLVRNFYEKWYVANNMELYIVGNIDPVKVEEEVKKVFAMLESGEVDSEKNRAERPIVEGVIIDKFVDEQLTENKLSYINILPIEEEVDKVDEYLLNQLFNIAVSNRFNQKVHNNELLIEGFNIGKEDLNKELRYTEVAIGLNADDIPNSIVDGFAQLEQLEGGISPEEFEVAKEILATNINQLLASIENLSSSEVMEDLLNHSFEEGDYKNHRDFYDEASKKIGDIELNEVNQFMAAYFDGSEKQYLYSGFIDVDLDMVKEAIEYGRSIDLGKFELYQASGEPYTKEIKKGSIVEEVYDEEGNYVTLKLSNGSKVYLYLTDYVKDRVSFGAISRGGTNYLGLNELKAMQLFPSILQSGPGSIDNYDKYLNSQGFSLNFDIDKYSEKVSGYSNKQNTELLLANFYGFMIESKISQFAFDRVIEEKLAMINTDESVKERLFWREYNKVITNNDPRELPLTKEDLDKITKEEVLEVYNSRFSGADYDYYFIGDFDYEELKNNIEVYLASLPRKNGEEYRVIDKKERKTDDFLEMDLVQGEKSTVILRYGNYKNFDEDSEYYKIISGIIAEAELLKTLREELGGIYSLSLAPDIDQHILDRGYITISFSTDPDRVEEMVEATDRVMSNIVNGQISNETLEYIKAIYTQQYESELYTGDYHLDLFNRLILGQDEKLLPSQFNTLVNIENITEFFNKIYGGYRGVFILNPKK